MGEFARGRCQASPAQPRGILREPKQRENPKAILRQSAFPADIWMAMHPRRDHSKWSMDRESRPWSCSYPSSRMSVRSQLIMRPGRLRKIILRGTLRGRMVLASVSLSQAQLA